MLEAIGKELKIVRIRNDFTLNKVASDLGLSVETLRRYENNCNGLSVEKLEELLNYYKTKKSIFFNNICVYMHENEQET